MTWVKHRWQNRWKERIAATRIHPTMISQDTAASIRLEILAVLIPNSAHPDVKQVFRSSSVITETSLRLASNTQEEIL